MKNGIEREYFLKVCLCRFSEGADNWMSRYFCILWYMPMIIGTIHNNRFRYAIIPNFKLLISFHSYWPGLTIHTGSIYSRYKSLLQFSFFQVWPSPETDTPDNVLQSVRNHLEFLFSSYLPIKYTIFVQWNKKIMLILHIVNYVRKKVDIFFNFIKVDRGVKVNENKIITRFI